MVSWTASTSMFDTTIANYSVRYRLTNGTGDYTTVYTASTSIILRGLVPNAEYNVSVTGINSCGGTSAFGMTQLDYQGDTYLSNGCFVSFPFLAVWAAPHTQLTLSWDYASLTWNGSLFNTVHVQFLMAILEYEHSSHFYRDRTFWSEDFLQLLKKIHWQNVLSFTNDVLMLMNFHCLLYFTQPWTLPPVLL